MIQSLEGMKLRVQSQGPPWNLWYLMQSIMGVTHNGSHSDGTTTAHLHLLWSWNSTIWRLEHSRIYVFRGIFKGNSPNWVFSTGILNFPFQWWELTRLTCECHFWHGEFQLSEYWTAFAISLINGKHRENSNFSLTIILKILVNKLVLMKQVKESYSSGALFSYY